MARRATAVALLALVVAALMGGTAGAASAPTPPRSTGATPTPWLDPTPYWEATPEGAVWDLGGAAHDGQLPAGKASVIDPVVAITVDPAGSGYWLVTARGQVFAFGAARWHGSPASADTGVTTAVGLVATADGAGYWVLTAGGQVFAYGDAAVEPAVSGDPTSSTPAVGLTPTPDGEGYWVARADGTVDAYGDAPALAGVPAADHQDPVVGLAATPDGKGLWLVTSGGRVFTSGDATGFGWVNSVQLGQPVRAVVPTVDGGGYWLVAHDGDLHPFGDAKNATPPVLAFVHTDLTTGDRALDWAMAQQGKPYKWGGVGPDSFDCSGLTMMSWYNAGLAIPRVAANQYGAGAHVRLADLVAGDLVFWASNLKHPATIYHVAMYMGGGHIVQAPYTGAFVSTSWEGGTGLLPDGMDPSS